MVAFVVVRLHTREGRGGWRRVMGLGRLGSASLVHGFLSAGAYTRFPLDELWEMLCFGCGTKVRISLKIFAPACSPDGGDVYFRDRSDQDISVQTTCVLVGPSTGPIRAITLTVPNFRF
ncbi:hypothetical protein K439DRAFT_369588 [Ramaria rubella]|nr:hypothetical protein K439DRAFT_369588 [Ramaria rubella]